MAVALWALLFSDKSHGDIYTGHLSEHLSNVSQVVLFLFGALTIVEIIHVHGGLNLLVRFMKIRSKIASLWVIGVIAFFLSAILDNLTTTIVMVTMLKKMIVSREERLLFGGAVVIAANAGGAWTPIGDVTTTMLWVGGQITAGPTMLSLFIPSILCLIGSLALISKGLKGKYMHEIHLGVDGDIEPKGKRVFALGMLSLIAVPIFKTVTGLPPFMGILFSMSLMWLITDLFHRKHRDRQHLRVTSVIPKLDAATILFFLGILLSVGALETAGTLKNVASFLDQHIPSEQIIALAIGVISAVIDNVPLVAACMGMYSTDVVPIDASFWQLIAYCAGTGGSLLVIGSAAGVAFMSLEKVDFFWYVRRIAPAATIGYLLGMAAYHIF